MSDLNAAAAAREVARLLAEPEKAKPTNREAERLMAIVAKDKAHRR